MCRLPDGSPVAHAKRPRAAPLSYLGAAGGAVAEAHITAVAPAVVVALAAVRVRRARVVARRPRSLEEACLDVVVRP
jgi:hypothetical protein